MERIDLQSVLSRLFPRMRREFPKAQPWNDDQNWKFPKMEDMPLPGSWGIVVMHPMISDSPYQYATENLTLSIAHLKAPGPPRMFLTGWDEEARNSCVVSEPLFA